MNVTRLYRVSLIAVALAVCAVHPAPGAEVTFGPRHEMYVDGKLFLPVHAWAGAMKDLDRLKGHGVNVVLGLGDCSMSWKPISDETLKTTQRFLDELHRRDMYGAIIISAWWSKPANRGILKDKPLSAYINRFKDHPALLAWQVSSEDDMGLGRKARKEQGIEGWAPRPNATAKDVIARCKEVKAIDPDHPVVVMFSGGQILAADRKFTWTVPTPKQFYVEVSKHADIVYHDLFPVANNTADDLRQIADATDLLRDYSLGKHLWVAVDAGDRKRWSTKSHAPTGKEIRNELWQALNNRAHGVGFDYTSWKPTWASIRMSEDGEKGLTAAVKEIESLKGPILRGTWPVGTRVARQGEGMLCVKVRRFEGASYVFAVNIKPEAVQATITVRKLGNRTAKVIGEDRSVPVENDKIRDAFEGYAVHLYEIELKK